MAEKLRESGWRKENYRICGFLVHQTTGHAFNQGPFMDGAVMKQKDRGCLGRRWRQCVARVGNNFGKPTARAHKVPPTSTPPKIQWDLGELQGLDMGMWGFLPTVWNTQFCSWKGKVVPKTPKPYICSDFFLFGERCCLRRSWGAQSRLDSSGDQRGNAAFEIKMALLWKVSPLFRDVHPPHGAAPPERHTRGQKHLLCPLPGRWTSNFWTSPSKREFMPDLLQPHPSFEPSRDGPPSPDRELTPWWNFLNLENF